MKKIIYTALLGNYDVLKQPKHIDPEFDYVVFSNSLPEGKKGVWEVRKIPYDNKDIRRVSRWIKLHPHILFPDYEYSVWIDASIGIESDDFYRIMDEHYTNGIQMSTFKHPVRNCIYEEAREVFFRRKDVLKFIIPEIKYLKQQKYPRHNGLAETNCLFRVHNVEEVKLFCDNWWNMIERFSHRDQLSFNYILSTSKVKYKNLVGDSNSHNHYAFSNGGHKTYTRNVIKDDYLFMTKGVRKDVMTKLFYSLFASPSGGLKEAIASALLRIIELYLDIKYKKRKKS